MASGKLDLLAKKVYGKDLKGPPFTSKPQVVLFKVQLYYTLKDNDLKDVFII